MKDASLAAWREVAQLVRERAGHKCESCGAPDGAMITLGIHVGAPREAPAQPQPAWLDHWNGSVRARADGGVLEGGRFIALQRPMQVSLKLAYSNHEPTDLRPENLRALCQWHDLEHRTRVPAARQPGAVDG